MTRTTRFVLVAGLVVFAAGLALEAQGPGRGRGGRGAAPLPEGPGRAIVEESCSTCHGANQVRGAAGYDRAGWQALVDTMIRLPESDHDTVLDYLATHFPEQPDRRPTLVPGDVEIEFKEWIVPTLGQRPRDPFQQADGTIWWAGMYASVIGRLNPETGQMREYPLASDARPHSVTADAEGNIWYTGNGNATIGRLDPDTGEIDVFPMPDPAAADPHTLLFDQAGTLWFTVQRGNMVGRLDPATGTIDLKTVPTPNARPYGLVISSEGVPWVCYNGANGIATIDPDTMEFTEFKTSTPDTTIRRLDLASDGTIYYVDSGRGYVGHLDPSTGMFTDWPSPSGPASHPYAIAVIDDIVWYNESNQRPDALVRFDPATETFQSWAIPSGVGIIRNMQETPDGNLVIHQSSSNRVGLVLID